MRSLSHGVPAHELQLMDPDFRQDGTTDHSVESGAAVALLLRTIPNELSTLWVVS